MEKIKTYLTGMYDLIVQYGGKVLLAIVFLIVGLIVIKQIGKALVRILKRSDVDASLQSFLRSLSGIILKALLFISVLSMVGVEMASFIAIMGAAGLAVGLALQGTLQNFAGGVLILLFKPYKVGDYIEANGHAGSVSEIQIFNTILLTPDNKTVIIPNSPMATNSLINYSAQETRRVDFVFGIGYNDDIDLARKVLTEVMEKDPRVLKDPALQIVVSDLADSSVNFAVRVWVKSTDYWNLYFEKTEEVKKAFDKAGISIPFPQQDMHVYEHKAE